MRRARVLSRDEPFVPIVRALTEQPLDSPAFLRAAEAASPEEAAFAARIVTQRKSELLARKSEINRELYQIQRGY